VITAGTMVSNHPTLVRVGRVGWLAKGVVYVLCGLLALLLAVRSFGWSAGTTAAGEASPTGAIKTLARSGGGSPVLVALAIGMFLYAAWRLVEAFMPGDTGAESVAKRVGYVISAAIHTSLGFTAIALSRQPAASADGNKTVTDATVRLMRNNAGRVLIGVVGVIVVATGLYHVVNGLRGGATRDVDMAGMSSERRSTTRRLGTIGESGRGVAIGLIGAFLTLSALHYNPAEATGMDGALRKVALAPGGRLLVVVAGVGLLAYGLFCAATFTRQRLRAPA
jgi:hypothetical protein